MIALHCLNLKQFLCIHAFDGVFVLSSKSAAHLQLPSTYDLLKLLNIDISFFSVLSIKEEKLLNVKQFLFITFSVIYFLNIENIFHFLCKFNLKNLHIKNFIKILW